jgi:CheY-like chemotaxis protein
MQLNENCWGVPAGKPGGIDCAVGPRLMSQPHATIVVVDDDPDTVECLCDYLTEMGFNAVSCRPELQAGACIAQHMPRVVILDVDLGVVTGVDVFHQLRADVTTRLVPVIFFTANAGKLRHALPDYQARGAALVVKPNIAGLHALIHDFVHQHA